MRALNERLAALDEILGAVRATADSQASIAAAQILLAIAFTCWIPLLVVRREGFEAPPAAM